MITKIVDLIDEGGSVAASYEIKLGYLNREVTDQDFIEQAMEDCAEDGLSPTLVTEWRVRDPD